MFDNDRYITKGIQAEIPLELQLFFWNCIDTRKIQGRNCRGEILALIARIILIISNGMKAIDATLKEHSTQQVKMILSSSCKWLLFFCLTIRQRKPTDLLMEMRIDLGIDTDKATPGAEFPSILGHFELSEDRKILEWYWIRLGNTNTYFIGLLFWILSKISNQSLEILINSIVEIE